MSSYLKISMEERREPSEKGQKASKKAWRGFLVLPSQYTLATIRTQTGDTHPIGLYFLERSVGNKEWEHEVVFSRIFPECILQTGVYKIFLGIDFLIPQNTRFQTECRRQYPYVRDSLFIKGENYVYTCTTTMYIHNHEHLSQKINFIFAFPLLFAKKTWKQVLLGMLWILWCKMKAKRI